MKKIISFLLVILMLVVTGASVAVSADEPTYKLVTHWDFEGSDPYADKATEGVSDTLTSVGNVTVANGLATVGEAVGIYLKASGAEGTDLHDMANKTILLKVKLGETKRKVVAAFLSKADCFAYGVGIYGVNVEDGLTPHAAKSFIFSNNTVVKVIDSNVSMVMDEFRMMAVSFDYNEVTNKVIMNQYMSTKENPESAEDFTLMISREVTDPDLATNGDFILGRRYDHLDGDRKMSAIFDDVKVFEGILTPAQLANESPEARPEVSESTSATSNTDTQTSATPPASAQVVPPVRYDTDPDDIEEETTVAETTEETEEEKKKGCGSAIGTSVIFALSCTAGTALWVSKKRKRND